MTFLQNYTYILFYYKLLFSKKYLIRTYSITKNHIKYDAIRTTGFKYVQR